MAETVQPRALAARWQRVAISKRSLGVGGRLAAHHPLRPECRQLQVRPRTGASGARQAAAITSHHPLRETLITQLGPDANRRHQALVRRHTAAIEMIRSTWKPSISPPSASITLSTLGRLRPTYVLATARRTRRDAVLTMIGKHATDKTIAKAARRATPNIHVRCRLGV